jgi:hypothetical protein
VPNNVLGLTRQQLADFLPDQQSIRAFEKLVIDATTTTPENVEAVTNIANSALAMAAAAISQLSELVEALDAALSAPADMPPDEQEDFVPNYSGSFGTLAYQNDDDVEITGGLVTGVTISSASGSFTTLTASSAVTLSPSNANVVFSPTGTGTVTIAPATAGSINNVSIGAVTPKNGTFKQVQTDGTATSLFGTNSTNSDVIFRGSNSGVVGGAAAFVQNNGTTIVGIGNKSRLLGTAYDATPYIFSNAVVEFANGARFNGNMGFYGATAIAKPTVTGSRAGNAALASLLTALANYGLVTDSSTV